MLLSAALSVETIKIESSEKAEEVALSTGDPERVCLCPGAV